MVNFCRYLKNKIGFSLIEVVATVALLGLVAVPFFSIFLTGNKNAIESTAELYAINLAREKIEELKLMSFENLDEDYYRFREIYKDTIHSELKEADEDIEVFYDNFSDIWTESLKEKYPRIFLKFENIIKSNGPLTDYIIYPENYSMYRRYTVVEEYEVSDNEDNFSDQDEVKMKKITVSVFMKKYNKTVELSALVSDYK